MSATRDDFRVTAKRRSRLDVEPTRNLRHQSSGFHLMNDNLSRAQPSERQAPTLPWSYELLGCAIVKGMSSTPTSVPPRKANSAESRARTGLSDSLHSDLGRTQPGHSKREELLPRRGAYSIPRLNHGSPALRGTERRNQPRSFHGISSESWRNCCNQGIALI